MVKTNGWGSGMREVSNDRIYELKVFRDGRLQGSFRTESLFGITVVKSEAEKLRDRLKRQFPDSSYDIREERTAEELYII
ncbi:MAG: hypothetical protein KKG75_05410 [Nanoarchaeota archaeon]|nr:hypothetical protein [Nanoarchaeota archaeon]